MTGAMIELGLEEIISVRCMIVSGAMTINWTRWNVA
jgi:hypothetical protein